METGGRRVLPLLASVDASEVARVVAGSAALQATLDAAIADVADPHADDLTIATHLLAARGGRDALSVASWRAGLAAPVMLSSLGEGLGGPAPPVQITASRPAPPPPPPIRAPRVLAVLASAESRRMRTTARTSVSDDLLRAVLDEADGVPRTDPPSLTSVGERLTPAIPARLVASAARAQVADETFVCSGAVPPTSAGSPGAAAVALRAAPTATLDALARRTGAFQAGRAAIADGEVVVVEFPDADLDTREQARPALICRAGRVRVVLLAAAGRVLADTGLARGGRQALPAGTRAAVLVGGSPLGDHLAPWTVSGGWTAARPLPSVSDGLLVAAGAVVDVIGRVPYRGADPARAAWAVPAELLGRERATATTLAAPAAGEPDTLAALAIALSGHGTDGVAVGLDGARQIGSPLVTTTASGAGVLVVALDGAERGGPVTVTVAADPGAPRRDLLGLVAAAGSAGTLKQAGSATAAAWLAGALAGADLAAVVPPPTAPGPDTSMISWEVA